MKLLGIALYYALYPVLRFIAMPLSQKRVRVLVESEAGTVLLVKTWFGRQRWSLPGGGIEKGESPEVAAIRELKEETAIVAHAEELELIGEMKGTDGLPFDLIVYRLPVGSEQLAPLQPLRQLEIIERRWWPISQLPVDRSPVVSWSLGQEH